jgi:carbamoyl-phosphate synthase large subunit
MAGKSLRELGFTQEIQPKHVSVKEAVFPFVKFPGVDTLLGPEMKSTGEVMGIDRRFGRAYAKAQAAAGNALPTGGAILVSLRDEDKAPALEPLRALAREGFGLHATHGTARFLREHGLEAQAVNAVPQGSPHAVDLLLGGGIALVINTTRLGDPKAVRDSAAMRRTALERGIPYFTTLAGARAAAEAIREIRAGEVTPVALQDLY